MVLAQRNNVLVGTPFKLFPSHYGSRSTHHFAHHPSFLHVSIPLWFSLNLVDDVTDVMPAESFHPTMVLAQRGGSYKPRSSQVVSIPLWFSLNSKLEDSDLDLTPFPSHYGSRSTERVHRAYGGDSCFHPTMVLAQRDSQRSCSRCVKRFHPTMVLAQQPLLQKIIQDYRG